MSKLVLRCCRSDFTSRNDFVWPSEVGAVVVAPDWEPTEECGNGLHGWLYGHGDIACVTYWEEADSKWLVLEVDDVIELNGKCKFERAVVRFVGAKSNAAAFLLENEPLANAEKVIGLTLSAGDEESLLVGTLGTATVGNGGTATVGDYGTATVGNGGTATVGYKGTATVGDYGTVTGGENAELRIRWYDYGAERYRTAIAYVGENGIKPNTPYLLNDEHQFVEVV